MRLKVHRNGVKLFFLTFTVLERKPILSQLVDERSRPALSPLGEIVKLGLLAIHKHYPAAGISDFVIMPDHVHFLLVVDFRRAPSFNPLWVVHRLMDAIEAAWNERGRAPAPPDMVAHFATAVARGRETAASLRVAGELAMHSACTQSPDDSGGILAQSFGVRGLAPSVPSPPTMSPAIFERSPYIELSFDPRQLKATRHYIRLNPARALWKQRHPDCFLRLSIPWQKVLPLSATPPNPTFHAMGNALLLASPFLFHVRLTLKKSVAEHESAIVEIIEKARRGMIPISGFISPGEKEALRRLKAEPRARFIKLLPCALPPRYDPSAEDSRELAADRLLILSGFPDTPSLSSFEMRANPAAAHAFRRNCLAMNDLAAAICQR